MTVKLPNSSLKVPINVKTWADVNVTIPEDASVPLKIGVLGASLDGRAVLVMTTMKISAAGINVACVRNVSLYNVESVTSNAITTSQKDYIYGDLGYVTNTGKMIKTHLMH